MKRISILVGVFTFFLLVFSFALTTPAFGKKTPEVANVQFQEYKPGQVIIYYDLTGEADKKYVVKLAFSSDGGQTYRIKPSNLSGEVGKGILPGIRKKIVWEVSDDYPEGLPEGRYVCQVIAKRPGKIWPWLAGGGLAAGGVAAYLLLQLEEEPTTGTIVIEIPDEP